MQKSALEFQVQARVKSQGTARSLRRNNLVPAIVYGPTQKPLPLSLDIRSAEKYGQKKYENKIFTFRSEDKELNGLRVIRKTISYNKVTRKPLHIDFLSLDANKPVRVPVEVLFKGKAKGVKEAGGVFSVIRRSVEVECLPAHIPADFSIDISGLEINQNFHVSDLNIPPNVKLITSAKNSLCVVSEVVEEKTSEEQAKEEAVSSSEEKKPEEAKKDTKK